MQAGVGHDFGVHFVAVGAGIVDDEGEDDDNLPDDEMSEDDVSAAKAMISWQMAGLTLELPDIEPAAAA